MKQVEHAQFIRAIEGTKMVGVATEVSKSQSVGRDLLECLLLESFSSGGRKKRGSDCWGKITFSP